MTRIGLAVALAIVISVPVLGQAQEKKPPAAKATDKPAAAKAGPATAKPADKPAAAKTDAKAEKPAVEKAAEKPVAKPAVAKAEKADTRPAARSVSDAPRRSRANEDARICLQRNTDLEMRKCAEQYR